MEEAPNSDPKDELLEFGFDSDGSEVNYAKDVIPEEFSKNGHQITSENPVRLEDINKQNSSKPKKKPRIKLQDSRYGEWKKGMAELQSLPFLANIVSKTKKTTAENIEKPGLQNSAVKLQPPIHASNIPAGPDTKRSSGQISNVSKTPLEGPRSPVVPKASTKMLRYIKLASSQSDGKPIGGDYSRKTSQPGTTAVNSSLTSSYAVATLDTIVVAGNESVEELLFQNRFDIPISAPHQPLRILHKLRNSRIVKRKIPMRNPLLNSISALGSAGLEPVNGSFLSSKPVINSEPILSLQVHGFLQKDLKIPADIRRKRKFPSLDKPEAEQPNLKASLMDLRRQLQQFESLPRVSRTQDVKPSLADSKPFSKIGQEIKGADNSQILKARQSRPEVFREVKMPSILGVGFKLDRRGARSDLQPNKLTSDTQASAPDSRSQEVTPKRKQREDPTWLEQQILRDFKQYHGKKSAGVGE